jgi:hypothetical protein
VRSRSPNERPSSAAGTASSLRSWSTNTPLRVRSHAAAARALHSTSSDVADPVDRASRPPSPRQALPGVCAPSGRPRRHRGRPASRRAAASTARGPSCRMRTPSCRHRAFEPACRGIPAPMHRRCLRCRPRPPSSKLCPSVSSVPRGRLRAAPDGLASSSILAAQGSARTASYLASRSSGTLRSPSAPDGMRSDSIAAASATAWSAAGARLSPAAESNAAASLGDVPRAAARRPVSVDAPNLSTSPIERSREAASSQARLGGVSSHLIESGDRAPRQAHSSTTIDRSILSSSGPRVGGSMSEGCQQRRQSPGPSLPARPFRCSASDADDAFGHQSVQPAL